MENKNVKYLQSGDTITMQSGQRIRIIGNGLIPMIGEFPPTRLILFEESGSDGYLVCKSNYILYDEQNILIEVVSSVSFGEYHMDKKFSTKQMAAKYLMDNSRCEVLEEVLW